MKKNIISLISFILLFVPLSALAQIALPNPLNTSSFQELIEKITYYISSVVGGLAVIVFIWAGILFLTSGGSETQLSKAKKALFYAAIGLAIALAASGLIVTIKYVIRG